MTKSKENFFKIDVCVNSIIRFQIINHVQFTGVVMLLVLNLCPSFCWYAPTSQNLPSQD